MGEESSTHGITRYAAYMHVLYVCTYMYVCMYVCMRCIYLWDLRCMFRIYVPRMNVYVYVCMHVCTYNV